VYHFHLVCRNVTEFGLFFNGRGNSYRVDDNTGRPVLQIQSMGLFHIKSKNFSAVHIYTDPLKCLREGDGLYTRVVLLVCHISLCVSEMSGYMFQVLLTQSIAITLDNVNFITGDVNA
jgi:hypothetical protein